MSLWGIAGSLLKTVGSAAAMGIAGGLATKIGGGGGTVMPGSGVRSVPAVRSPASRLGLMLAAPAAGALAGAGVGYTYRSMTGGVRQRRMTCRFNRCTGSYEWVPARRRMRVTNVKALRRSLRRVEGFERVARKVLRITMGGSPGVRFKKARKRR